MEKKQTSLVRGAGKYLVALLFILSGVLLLARNVGWLDEATFHIIVSWQMLLIVMGLFSFYSRKYFSGLVLLVIGGCFLLLELDLPCFPVNFGSLVWPLVLVLVGLSFLVRSRKREHWKCRMQGSFGSSTTNQCNSTDGFVRSDNVFSGVRQVVLDEVFKGAVIHNTFGGTVVDLRRTSIAEGETYIDLDCTFGGVEIYVPSEWKVDIRCNAFLGGCEDKRFQSVTVDQSRVLVIRGDVSFGGVEIKS